MNYIAVTPLVAVSGVSIAEAAAPVKLDRTTIARRVHALATEMSELLGQLDDAMWEVRVSPPFRGIANFSIHPARSAMSTRTMAGAIEDHVSRIAEYERLLDTQEEIEGKLPPASIPLQQARVGSEIYEEKWAFRPADVDKLAHVCCPGYGADQPRRLPAWIAEKKRELNNVRRRRRAAIERTGYVQIKEQVLAASNFEDSALATLILQRPQNAKEAAEKLTYLTNIGIDESQFSVRSGVIERVFEALCQPRGRIGHST